jgi:hypothetical protein
VDQKYKSERLKALDAAGKIKTASVTNTTLTRRGRTASNVKGSKGSKAAPSQRAVKIVPFQQVEEGVFIQKVRVKTIKVKKLQCFVAALKHY